MPAAGAADGDGQVVAVFLHHFRQPAREERAHEVVERIAFGRPLADQGVIREWIADSSIEIEQARLLAMPDYPMVWLPHPVAIVDEEGIRRLAREAAAAIVRRLTA